MCLLELRKSDLWFLRPKFLVLSEHHWPKVCLNSSDNAQLEFESCAMVNENTEHIPYNLSTLIPVESFRFFRKLVNVTAYVLKFIKNIKRTLKVTDYTISELQSTSVTKTAD